MLESPLKKNKHAYPIDFSTKKKSSLNNNTKKYDMDSFNQNPQNLTQQNRSIFSKKSSLNQIPIQSNKKYSHNVMEFQEISHNQIDKKQDKSKKHSVQNSQKIDHNNQKYKFNGELESQDTEEPLKEVKRINQRIVVDETKLKNPRIQMNEQKDIYTTEKTLQIDSPISQLKRQKHTQIGGIKRQDFSILQKYQNQKQNPLLPEQPFNIVHKNMRTKSLLSKLKLNNIQQNNNISQSNHYQNQVSRNKFNSQLKDINSQSIKNIINTSQNNYFYNSNNNEISSDSKVFSGNQYFRPETYTYANKFINQQNDNINMKRSSSSFQVQKQRTEKIIYMKNGKNDSFSFNLPNISFQNDHNKFKKVNTSHNLSLNSKFAGKQLKERLNFSKIKLQNLSQEQNQLKSKFQPNQISKLKAQINQIVKKKFRNNQQEEEQKIQAQRQFTFDTGQQKRLSSSDRKKISNSQQITPKKRLEITYHVPLVQLKSICKKYLSDKNSYRIAFKVPKIFMEQSLFSRYQQKQQLHQNSIVLFQSLKISTKNLIVKRYSNCVIFTTGHIAVIWYYNGKRYLGGWQYQYLDQGARHGLGLQWEPNSFIYYGQFRSNKKYGLGALKQGPQNVSVGYWCNDNYVGTIFREEDQNLFEGQRQQQEPQQTYFNTNYHRQYYDGYKKQNSEDQYDKQRQYQY